MDTYSETMSLRTESFLVGLIGDGITSSLTPPMHEAEADAHGVRYLYRPVDLDALNLDGASAPALLDAAALLGFNAFNITHPCKQSVMEHLHELSDAARALGAVNCVVIGEDGSFYGDNTDYSGFIAGLKRGLPQVAEDPARLEHVVQLGAGGAGSATAYALCRLGVRRLSLFERDAAKAQGLAEQLGKNGPDTDVHQSRQVILVTKDILLRIKAQIIGIRAEDFMTEQVPGRDGQYTGRAEVYAPEESFKDFKKKGIPVSAVYMADQDGSCSVPRLWENQFIIVQIEHV